MDGSDPSISIPLPTGGARFGRRPDKTEETPQDTQLVNEIADSIPELEILRTQCMARLDTSLAVSLEGDALFNSVSAHVAIVAADLKIKLNQAEQTRVAQNLVDDMNGLGPLQSLIDDDSISDIMVNGPNLVFVERNGLVVETPVKFRDSQHLTSICQRIATTIGRRVDESSPMVDARLKDGSRVNIVLPPSAIDGAALSIRKFRRKPIEMSTLVAYGSITEPIATMLEIIACCRLNIVISGGTGSGKTTLMNAMSRSIDPGERIVTVEDAAELQLQQRHVVRLETRPANIDGKNEINQRDLVRNALRMRPDRIIIGEVRGPEAFDMLQAMNTGHDGSMSTVHANNARDAISRIENMVQMANAGLSNVAIRQQIVSAVNIIIQIQRGRDGQRRLMQLTEISGMENGVPLLNDLVLFESRNDGGTGRVQGRYKIMQGRSSAYERMSYFGLANKWRDAVEQAAKDS
jgi:pilus assembly protein CpaF